MNSSDLYLDANAHVPMSAKTLKKYSNFNNSLAAHGHPLSPSVPGRAAAAALEEARTKVAELIGAEKAGQIIFTHSCTQACEWLAKILRADGNYPGSSIHISPIEHPAMSQAIKDDHIYYDVTKDGEVLFPQKGDDNYEELEYGICIHMQNEIGTIQDISKIPDTWKISDMSQSLGKWPINVTGCGVNYAVFGGHKFGGPSGVGFLYLKDTREWEEFGTGSRYFMDIPGTPNVGAIVAAAVALEEAIETLDNRLSKMYEFRYVLEPGLERMGFEIIGKGASERCPNTTFTKVPGHPNAGLVLMNKLGKAGIYVGLGSACGSLYTGGSPLMEALGRPSDGQDYIRISQWGEYGVEEAENLLETIQKTIKEK